jgi:hypothetical protein
MRMLLLVMMNAQFGVKIIKAYRNIFLGRQEYNINSSYNTPAEFQGFGKQLSTTLDCLQQSQKPQITKCDYYADPT